MTEKVYNEKIDSFEQVCTISGNEYQYLHTDYNEKRITNRMANLEQGINAVTPGSGGA